jgi:hypothetical protein
MMSDYKYATPVLDSEIKQVPFESQYVLELEFPKRAMSHIERKHYQYGNFRTLLSTDETNLVDRINEAMGMELVTKHETWYHIDGMECSAWAVSWYATLKFVTPREWRSLNSRLSTIEFAKMQMYQIMTDRNGK